MINPDGKLLYASVLLLNRFVVAQRFLWETQIILILKILFSDINYFHCVEIVRLLKQTEDTSRNIFGRYSSQRLKVCVCGVPFQIDSFAFR